MHKKFWTENLKGRGHVEGLDIDGRIILRWLLRKLGGKVWTGFMWIRIETSGQGNELQSSINCGKFHY
jgi:hypothetical protein